MKRLISIIILLLPIFILMNTGCSAIQKIGSGVEPVKPIVSWKDQSSIGVNIQIRQFEPGFVNQTADDNTSILTFDTIYPDPNGQQAESVCQTNDGGYVIVGYSETGSYGKDLLVMKIDEKGTQQWKKVFKEQDGWELAHDVQPTDDGGYIITGENGDAGGRYSLQLIKLDTNGDKEWSNDFGHAIVMTFLYGNIYPIYDQCFGYSVLQDTERNFVAVGFGRVFPKSLGLSETRPGIVLVKTDPEGNAIFQKTFGSVSDVAYSVVQADDCGYVIAGQTGNYEGNQTFADKNKNDYRADACIIKTDSNGNVEWTRRLSGQGQLSANSICRTNDSGYVFVGSIRQGYTEYVESGDVSYFRAPSSDIYLVKLDNLGNVQWTHILGNEGTDEFASSVMQTGDGGFVVSGTCPASANFSRKTNTSITDNAFLFKTDQEGNIQWLNVFNSSKDSYARSACQTSDNGFVLTGYISNYDNGTKQDVYIIKTDASGKVKR